MKPILILLAASALVITSVMSQGKVTETKAWVNISNDFFANLGVENIKPSLNRCQGMLVTPTGEIFILVNKNYGVCVSKDHGTTWAVVPNNNITGRCETGFGFSMSYPYKGRFAFFSIDGSGGISVDDGTTWRPFSKILRNFEFADVDWSVSKDPTIFGLLHEPYYTTLSTDGGRNWQQLYKELEEPKTEQKWVSQYCLGVFNTTTLVRSHLVKGGIEMSIDGGKTWMNVSTFKVLGRRPVHYGQKLYWTTTDGVIVSKNGKEWKLTGKGPSQAVYGPYFGNNEQEFMVVSDKAFFLTHNGGKTWAELAQTLIPLDAFRSTGFNVNGQFNYFGWDPKHNFIYVSSLGGSIFRKHLK